MRISLLTIGFVCIIGFIIKPVFQLNIIEWTNITFIISIISFLIAACIFIMASGFLDFFFQGFTRLNNVIFRKPRALERIDEEFKQSSDVKNVKETMSKVLIQQATLIGISALLLSIIGLCLT